ncbi:protein-tyrosine phosphatase family protein [Proteus sp. FME41]|uniref:protein-tyrosine phosphatase family protein n=1 Tax=Proteus sp. FME41 TaxID=2742608 RepID=UPI001867F251|nr:protein-tyrosine phosphatase family protein [Proteus sp. FME41]
MILSPVNQNAPSSTVVNLSKTYNEGKGNIQSDIIRIENTSKETKPILLPKPPAGSPIYTPFARISALPVLPPKPPIGSPIYSSSASILEFSILLEKVENIGTNNNLPSRHNRAVLNIPKFNISQSNEDIKLSENRKNFLEAVKKCINTDKYNEKATKLFNNLNCLKYNYNDYQSVENSRYSNQLEYRKETLIKIGEVVLPANNVSSYNSPNMTIASQYPLNNKENLNNYFNMLFDNDIDTVYVLASNDDIKKDLSKLGREYNRGDFENEGFKYFKENLGLDDIKTKLTEKWMVREGDKDKPTLSCKAYVQSMAKNSSNETKNIKFVHVYDWKDHTGIDATKLRNTIDVIGGNLKIKPTKENIVVHCLAGLGRTGEFIALIEMIKMLETGNTKGKSLENIISDLREKRSVSALYQPEQIAELVKYAINNNIPLLNDDIKMR